MVALGQSVHIVEHIFSEPTTDNHSNAKHIPNCDLCVVHFNQVIADEPLTVPEAPENSLAVYQNIVPYSALTSANTETYKNLRAPPFCA